MTLTVITCSPIIMHELETTLDDCLVWSETCATPSTTQSVNAVARRIRSFAVCSSPSGSRQFQGSTVTGRGHATGSLIFSKSKARNLNNLWSAPCFSTGRVADALFTVGNTQLRVISVYGYNSNIPHHLGLNQVLFEEIFSKAASFQCPLPGTLITTFATLRFGLTTLPLDSLTWVLTSRLSLMVLRSLRTEASHGWTTSSVTLRQLNLLSPSR